MTKKLISAILSAVLVLSSALVFSGCGNEEYPVKIANIEIKNKPKSIVVLDDSAADIISYLGYDDTIVGRSNEVDQEWLSIAPSVGAASTPDVSKIKAAKPDIVFAGDSLNSQAKSQLEQEGIQVITMAPGDTPTMIETNYITIGKIFDGAVTGSNKGSSEYSKLIDLMEETEKSTDGQLSNGMRYTMCYLYQENNVLKLVVGGSYANMLMEYTGGINIAAEAVEENADVNTLKIANPNFIFYADEATLNVIKSDDILKTLSAVKGNKMLMLSEKEISRQGQTALLTLDKMIEFMYPKLKKSSATPEQPATQPSAAVEASTAPQSPSQTATAAATTAASSVQNTAASVADKYKINLNKLSLDMGDDDNSVKILQKRLFDLGYVTDKGNITGYYGEATKAAVKLFQKNNKLPQTGQADNKTLGAIFNSAAVKAEPAKQQATQ